MRKPTSAVMGSAVAPMRYRWPDTSRHGPLRGARARRPRSSTSWPTISSRWRAWSTPCSTSTPRWSICSPRRQGSGGGATQVNWATRVSMVRWLSVQASWAGQACCQWFHSSCAPTWSSHCSSRRSQPRVGAGGAPRSWSDTACHCFALPSSAAPQRPRSCAHGPWGVSVRTTRCGARSVMGVGSAGAAPSKARRQCERAW